MTDNEHRRHEHAFNGMAAAAALVARAVAGDNEGLWELVDAIAAGDEVRETVLALGQFAAGYAVALAHFQNQPVGNVVSRLAGLVADAIAEEE